MDLYLIRHADALMLGERGITDDAERPLSEQGENQMETVARGLVARGMQLDLVICSPFVRARQTAEILQRHWSPAPFEIRFSETLQPEVKPRKIATLLRQVTVQNVGLVGHNPHLSLLAAWLIGSKKARLELAKSGIARIDCDDIPAKGAGSLRWMLTPEWF